MSMSLSSNRRSEHQPHPTHITSSVTLNPTHHQQQQYNQHLDPAVGTAAGQKTFYSAVIQRLESCDEQDEILNKIQSQRYPADILNLISSRFTMASSGSNNYNNSSICAFNCSGHGECYEGTCLCQVEYSGGACDNPNLKYYIAFSTIFYMICAVSFVQLVLCINSEFSRQKPRSLFRAFRVTTQKALYFFICLATGIRGFYFSSPEYMSGNWAATLTSAYYPLLMTSSSLIVCFWAEVFHLHDVSPERPGFLSKSFTGFILFNVVTYSLLLAELVLLHFADASEAERYLFLSIFNSIYAILMLVVVVFFLIYGVEVYFKIRGAFIQGESCPANISQLHQSRVGLISQAVLLLVTVLFIISDVFGSFWKNKVPVLSRNTHEIMFRVVEMGVALWFPCVLWNCFRPEALWILNPRKILERAKSRSDLRALTDGRVPLTRSDSLKLLAECWICYDSERTDAGPLIQPCLCRGDVSAVHHDCLKTWLVESNSDPGNVKCKVCNESYRIQRGDVWLPAGLTITHWFQTAAIVSVMCSAAASSFLVVKLFDHMYVRTISVGSTILVEYICLRFLGFNLLSAYNRAKMSAIKIGGRLIMQQQQTLHQQLPQLQQPIISSSPHKVNGPTDSRSGSFSDPCPSPGFIQSLQRVADDQMSETSIPLSISPSCSSSQSPLNSQTSKSISISGSSSTSMSDCSQDVVVIHCEAL